MSSQKKTATFRLRQDVLAALDVAVAQGAASSKNAFVEQALVKELKEVRRQARRAAWGEALRDPLFLQDLEAVEASFRPADAETTGKKG